MQIVSYNLQKSVSDAKFSKKLKMDLKKWHKFQKVGGKDAQVSKSRGKRCKSFKK